MATTIATRVETVSKEEAATILGISPRRVLEYAQSGALRSEKLRNPQTNLWQIRIHAGDLERLRLEREQPRPSLQSSAALQSAPTALSSAPSAPVPEAPEIRPFDHLPPCVRLNVREASAYLRMPATFIAALVRSGALPHTRLPNGGIRIKRSDLDAL